MKNKKCREKFNELMKENLPVKKSSQNHSKTLESAMIDEMFSSVDKPIDNTLLYLNKRKQGRDKVRKQFNEIMEEPSFLIEIDKNSHNPKIETKEKTPSKKSLKQDGYEDDYNCFPPYPPFIERRIWKGYDSESRKILRNYPTSNDDDCFEVADKVATIASIKIYKDSQYVFNGKCYEKLSRSDFKRVVSGMADAAIRGF